MFICCFIAVAAAAAATDIDVVVHFVIVFILCFAWLQVHPNYRPTSCLLFLISLPRYYDVCIWFCVCMCVFPFSYKRMEYTYVCMCVCHHYHCLLLVLLLFLLLWSHISFWSLLVFLVAERTSAQWFPFCLQILVYLCDCVCACVCMFTWIWELFCVNVIFVMSIPLCFSHCYTKRVYLLFVISVVFGVVGVVAVFVFVLYETMCIIYAFSLVSFIFMCFKRISQQQYAI